jgi:ribosomal protein S9
VTVNTTDGGTGGKTAAFTVGAPAKTTVTGISPSGTWARNTTVNYTITGTNFEPGTTQVTLWNASGNALNASSGSGVWLVTPTVIYGMVVVPYGAPSKTPYNVTVTTYNGGTAGKTSAFTVGAPAKTTVTGISPSGTWARNTTVNYTITGTNFEPGTTQVTLWNASGTALNASSGSGVWLVTPTTIYGTVVVPFGAPSKTPYNVTVTTFNGGTAGKSAAFTVGTPAKTTVTGISPAGNWARNTTINYTIAGTNFEPGNTNVTLWNTTGSVLNATSGSGVWLVTPTTIYGRVVVPYEASSKTPYNVTVTTYNGGIAGKTAAFTVGTPAKATVTTVSPSGTWARNTTVNYTITGTNFEPGNTQVTLWNASGVPLNASSGSGVWLVTPTAIYGNVTVPYGASSKTPYNVTVTTYNGGTAGKTAAFTIAPAQKPVVTAVTPSTSWYRNNTLNYTITGTGFEPGNTQVTLWNASGSALNASSGSGVWLVTPSAIYGTVVVPFGASAKTPYNVTVTTYQGGTGGKTGAFRVDSLPAPTVSAVTPNTGYPNSTVAFTLRGTNFEPGKTTVTISHPDYGERVASLYSVTSTEIIGGITVPANPPTGIWKMNVTTFDGGRAGTGFTVKDLPAPKISSVVPASGFRGTTIAFTVNGDYFQPGERTTVILTRPGQSNIPATLNAVYPTRITGTIDIPAGAGTGQYRVKIKTLDGGESFLNNAITIL